MSAILEKKNPQQDVHEIIKCAQYAIEALGEYSCALHKLEGNVLSEAVVEIISYGDVRDTIRCLYQTKDFFENVMHQYETYLEYEVREFHD